MDQQKDTTLKEEIQNIFSAALHPTYGGAELNTVEIKDNLLTLFQSELSKKDEALISEVRKVLAFEGVLSFSVEKALAELLSKEGGKT